MRLPRSFRHLRRTLRRVVFAVSLAVGLGAAPACSHSAEASAEPPPLQCTPRSPASDDAFATEHSPDSEDVALARALADRTMAEHDPEAMPWDWGEGTLMLAFVDLYRITGVTAYRDYYKRFIDHHVERGYKITMSDRCPPALSALALYQETCEPQYRTVVDDVLRYLYEEAMRTEEGGISHMGTVPIFGATLWLDSLFMFGNVLVRWGELAGDQRALDEYSAQHRIFATLLQEPSGFFKHAWNWPGTQDPEVYWARGNAWVTAAGYEYLRVRKARGEADEPVQASLEKQVQAVLAAQDAGTGLWWTVVNRPGETYLETSASALFALGMARGVRYGFLGDSAAQSVQRAVDGVKSRIVLDDQGRPVVTGISGPTTVGRFSDYAKVEVGDDISYGVGAVILMLLEVSGLDGSSP